MVRIMDCEMRLQRFYFARRLRFRGVIIFYEADKDSGMRQSPSHHSQN